MSHHEHVRDHEHEHDGETYYLDQLCMIALSGAFGVICLVLYFQEVRLGSLGRSGMLAMLLGTQFHLFVLISGVALVALALARSWLLWFQPRQSADAEAQAPVANLVEAPSAHDHGHSDCGHDHGLADRAHSHAHGDHFHDHGHSHAEPSHSHSHAQGHGHEDHDHGWAPWRYVVLLIPIILFLLGLPNKPPRIGETKDKVDLTAEAMQSGSMVALAHDVWSALASLGKQAGDSSVGEITPIPDFKFLPTLAETAEDRKAWKGKTVSIKGQYSANPASQRVFSLVRLKIQCCAADVLPLKVSIISNEPITHVRAESWVQVTARVDFQQRDGAWATVLRVPGAKNVVPCTPDPNPYIQ